MSFDAVPSPRESGLVLLGLAGLLLLVLALALLGALGRRGGRAGLLPVLLPALLARAAPLLVLRLLLVLLLGATAGAFRLLGLLFRVLIAHGLSTREGGGGLFQQISAMRHAVLGRLLRATRSMNRNLRPHALRPATISAPPATSGDLRRPLELWRPHGPVANYPIACDELRRACDDPKAAGERCDDHRDDPNACDEARRPHGLRRPARPTTNTTPPANSGDPSWVSKGEAWRHDDNFPPTNAPYTTSMTRARCGRTHVQLVTGLRTYASHDKSKHAAHTECRPSPSAHWLRQCSPI